MKPAKNYWGALCSVAFLVVAGVTAWRIATWPRPEAKAEKPAPPAKVAVIVKEDSLNTIVLTAEVEERLVMAFGKVERKSLPRARSYAGEATVPAGKSIIVAAPLSGLLATPTGGLPAPGQPLQKGQEVFSLLPLLTPEARTTLAAQRVDAEGLIEGARTELEAAKIALARATRLAKQEAGSQRTVDEAQARHDQAVEALEAAQARHDLLTRALEETAGGSGTPIAITAPADGLLRALSALPGQNVPAGASLFELADLNRVWVRTAVYVGDLAEIDATAEAAVGPLTVRPGVALLPARPIAAPPSANALSATVDLYYEVENVEARLMPGQRLSVTLPLVGETESLAAPWSAVVYDIYGNAWVYERTAPHTYVRRRVTVRRVSGETAVLGDGPPPGTEVVAGGAYELFGAETGFSK